MLLLYFRFCTIIMHGISPTNYLHVLMVSPEFDYISVMGGIFNATSLSIMIFLVIYVLNTNYFTS